jgi:hypothetical protein
MTDCEGVCTPLVVNEKLSTTIGTPLGPKDGTQYRSIVGAL